MAFKKTIAQRLFNIYRNTNPSLTNFRTSSSSTVAKQLAACNTDKMAPDPGDNGIFRRFLHRQTTQTPSISPINLPGEGLLVKLRDMGIAKSRIRLDGLRPPPPPPTTGSTSDPLEGRLTVEDARKILKLSQLEMVKARLRQVERIYAPYDEFIEICTECCGNREHGEELAKMLDESGTVIVLKNVVFLKPEQVVRAIQGLMPVVPVANPNDPRIKELEAMEMQKSEIDKKADSLVRRELWGGLGYLVIQTVAFMRLTFWELSWDVMEPICFYVTSIYFMAGYGFFLRTSKEPSFEGFYQSRFSAKQKRVMKLQNFDVQRYNELRKIYRPESWVAPLPSARLAEQMFSSVYKGDTEQVHPGKSELQKIQ